MVPRRRRGDNYGVLLLVAQLLQAGPIPPITLVLILGQVAVFLGLVPFLDAERHTNLYCILPKAFERRGWAAEWPRLLAATFMHAHDMHLYFNMISLLWKGRRLENSLGSHRFAVMVAIFSVLCSSVTVIVSRLLDNFGPLIAPALGPYNYTHQCAIGFSGVVFALKVVLTWMTNEADPLLGYFPVPAELTRLACWAELFLIQVLVPNASFVGHLAGIIVGLLYTLGPLSRLVDIVAAIVEGRRNTNFRPFQGQPHRAGRSDYGWNQYTGGASEEEQVRRAQEESLRDHLRRRGNPPPAYGFRQ